MDLERLTREVCRVAREAGAYLREEQGRLHADQVERKHAHDYVSYVDKTCERQVVEQLRSLLPQAQFLTEEGTTEQVSDCPAPQGTAAPQSEDDGRALTWVVDPLDGTTNYIHGFNPFAVSIALRTEGEVLLGVIYEVSLDECFYAWQGGGAWLNGRPIHVSSKPIGEAMLGLELPYDADRYRTLGTSLISHFYGLCGGIRMNGSAAVALCNVACGRWDGWVERYIKPWDYMAGVIIIREAGGQVTNFQGSEACLWGDDIVASNGHFQHDLLQAIAAKKS